MDATLAHMTPANFPRGFTCSPLTKEVGPGNVTTDSAGMAMRISDEMWVRDGVDG